MPETFTLDGRKFAGISQALTANQDDYIHAHLRLAGAIGVLSDLDPLICKQCGIESIPSGGKCPACGGPLKRTKDERAEDLLTQILLSGRTHHILAGCLTEEGKTWNRKEADANAVRFGALTDIADKTAMRSSIVGFVIGFFSLGAESSETSRKSSSRSAKVPPTKNEELSTSATSRH